MPTSTPTSAPTTIPRLIYSNLSTCTYDVSYAPCCGTAGVIVIDSTVRIIKATAFKSCTSVTSVDFSNATNLEVIDDEAFSRMTSLTSVDMRNATLLSTIKYRAFEYNTNLMSVELSAATTSIGWSAFQDTGLINVSQVGFNGGECYAIEDSYFLSSFPFDCPPETYVYSDSTTCTYLNNGYTACCGTATVIVIDSTTTSIAAKAFESCYSVKSIDFSQAFALTSIGDNAMEYCWGLTSVDMSPALNLNSIGVRAFYSAWNIVSLKLSAATTTIGASAFKECTKLASAANVDFNGLSCTSFSPSNIFDWSSCMRRRLQATTRGGNKRRQLLKLTNTPTAAPTLGANETVAPTSSPLPPTMAFGVTYAPTSAPTAAPPPGCVWCTLGKYSPVRFVCLLSPDTSIYLANISSQLNTFRNLPTLLSSLF